MYSGSVATGENVSPAAVPSSVHSASVLVRWIRSHSSCTSGLTAARRSTVSRSTISASRPSIVANLGQYCGQLMGMA